MPKLSSICFLSTKLFAPGTITILFSPVSSINIVAICDDIFGSLIENCIENESFESLKIITKRKDLNVSIDDLKMADEYGIDLSEYGIEIAKKLKKAHDYAFANS